MNARKRISELGIVVGTAMMLAAVLAGCGAAGAGGWGSPEIVDAVGGLGSAAANAGTLSANPILFAAGTLLTGLATWLRIKSGGTPPPPPLPPSA
jgi:hypothetical protein